ncbi:MAG: hypothetical protein PHW14_01180 [Candidatus Omnitrophica bacterium]|nr:hypothetical protein [Candidatus Omnitrophota bacterium]
MRKHSGFIIFFSSVILFFMWRLLTLKAGFIYGDYADQFYPWSFIYSGAVKVFELPYWTRYVHSGYALMAEGQVGGFYPLNWVFFFLLPFKAAYNYLTVLHFVFAGVFTYIFTRRTGACIWGGSLAALLFCFGSAYAGCMVNTATVKTLCWFPIVLYFIEIYAVTRKPFFPAVAGLIFGMQLLAGQAQVAVYAGMFYFFYVIYRLRLGGGRITARDILMGLAAVTLAAVVFMPQAMLTKTMASLSWRAEASADFALSDSFSPFNFLSAVFPYPILRGARLYIGVMSLLFLVMSFYGLKQIPARRPLFAVFILALFLTLGRYNPFYVLAVKGLHLYGFRNPSKFILFGAFAASVMAGWGFTDFFAASWKSTKKKAAGVFACFIGAAMAALFLVKAVLAVFGDQIVSFGERYVAEHVYGKGFHRFDLDVYIEKVHGFYASLVDVTSFLNPFVLISVTLSAAALVMTWALCSREKQTGSFPKTIAIFFIFIDLVAFSSYGTGFRGNIMDFKTISPQAPGVLEAIKSDSNVFRILPYDIASAKLPNWAMPSMNAVYGVDSIALYTPLVNERYRKALEELEVADNALGLKSPEPGSLHRNLELIRMLNVRYVVSPYELEEFFLEPVMEEDGIHLYRLSGSLPRAFVAKELLPDMVDADVPVSFILYRPGEALMGVRMPYEGFLIFSECSYPGWEVYVDGKKAEIVPFSVIQAVKLPAGSHEVWFVFRHFGSKK